MPKTTIRRDLGEGADGCPQLRPHDIVTRPEDFPELSGAQVLDLHAAHVQIESLSFPRRMAAKQHLHRIGRAAGSGLCPRTFAGTIRDAIRFALDAPIERAE